jgi:hypothetical protein
MAARVANERGRLVALDRPNPALGAVDLLAEPLPFMRFLWPEYLFTLENLSGDRLL